MFPFDVVLFHSLCAYSAGLLNHFAKANFDVQLDFPGQNARHNIRTKLHTFICSVIGLLWRVKTRPIDCNCIKLMVFSILNDYLHDDFVVIAVLVCVVVAIACCNKQIAIAISHSNG